MSTRPLTDESGWSCDWGGCDNQAVAERSSDDEWLPVCVGHLGPQKRGPGPRGTCALEQQASYELGVTVQERDEARAEYQAQLEATRALDDMHMAEIGRVTRERDEARADRDLINRHATRAEAERDAARGARDALRKQVHKIAAERDAMRPVVEAARAWRVFRGMGASHLAADALVAAVDEMAARAAAVDQMAPPPPLVTPQPAQNGEVVGQAGQAGFEAQKSAEVVWRHPCGYSQVSPIPHQCPRCDTSEPWS